MSRKAKKKPEKIPPIPIIFRVPPSMYEDLQEAMTLLHIDMANLVRMMISEHVGEYIARGRKGANLVVRAREQPSEETREETSSLDVPVIGRRILDLGSDQDVASQASRVEERE